MRQTTSCLTKTTIATSNRHHLHNHTEYFRGVSLIPRSPKLLSSCILLLTAWMFAVSVHAQTDTLRTVIPGRTQAISRELQAIAWQGCSGITPRQLLGVIQSRESELSLTRRLALYYYDNLLVNKATPQQIMRTLSGVQRDLRDELRYFNPHLADDDSAAITRFYDVNGYHQAAVHWHFGFDSKEQKNTLTFVVNEGPRAVLDSILILGLENLPEDVAAAVNRSRLVKQGDPYSEAAIEADLRQIVRILQNTGYYRAGYERPVVVMSADKLHDSMVVSFVTGPRKRVANIVFEENASGFPTVNQSTRARQLEFGVGEWFSRDKIEQSRANLINLSVFETVLIDTLATEVVDSNMKSITDSALVIRVFTKNNKPHDVGANLLLYQTAVDNYLNFGVGATALHRNAFGGAQTASVTAQYVLQDIGRIVQGQPLQSEALFSAALGWPSLFRIWDWRGGLHSNAYYSLRLLVNPFRLEAFGVGVRLPVNLPQARFVNGFDITTSVERQVPRNFDKAIGGALKDSQTKEDTAYVLSTYNQFLVLDKFLSSPGRFFTGVYAGLSVRGEHRDNPIDPRIGYFFSLSSEVGFGAGTFLRSQLYYTQILPSSKNLTFATKIKVGHIQLLDFSRGSTGADTNTYVPLDRQFFAGGAASIRSYASRLLHDPRSGELGSLEASQNQILSNVVGSASLLELGFEARFRLPRPSGLDDFWADNVEKSGFTIFADIGNAFNRMTKDLYGSMTIGDLIKGSVIAAGVGYRYETPVGPFRVDYATSIYDPLRSSGQWITSRMHPFSTSNWLLSRS